jgi:hypothetical protein
METQKQTGRLFIVPADMMMDVLRIILKNGLKHYIEGINERENTILIRVFANVNSLYGKQAVQNIAQMLSDYGYYLHGDVGHDLTDQDDEDPFIYNKVA